MFGDEAVDWNSFAAHAHSLLPSSLYLLCCWSHQLHSRGDNGQRHRAELEHSIGMVTTALPSKCGKGDTFKSW